MSGKRVPDPDPPPRASGNPDAARASVLNARDALAVRRASEREVAYHAAYGAWARGALAAAARGFGAIAVRAGARTLI